MPSRRMGETPSGVAGDVDQLMPILLRLYEQAQEEDDPAVANRCLNSWDLMFETRVGIVRMLTKTIDS